MLHWIATNFLLLLQYFLKHWQYNRYWIANNLCITRNFVDKAIACKKNSTNNKLYVYRENRWCCKHIIQHPITKVRYLQCSLKCPETDNISFCGKDVGHSSIKNWCIYMHYSETHAHVHASLHRETQTHMCTDTHVHRHTYIDRQTNLLS